MSCRSMIFTLYGAYIRKYGNQISNQSLTTIMGQFGFSPESVRGAVFRMIKQGWLERKREGRNTFFFLTPEGKSRVRQGVVRIFEIDQTTWDEKWHLLTYSISEKRRNIRDELRRELVWLGFGTISIGTWVTPWNLKELIDPLIRKHQLEGQVEFFSSTHLGYSSNQSLVERCWNLYEISNAYKSFIRKWETRREKISSIIDQPAECFKEQILLIHDWRKFLHLDPKLPFVLLPDDWIGKQALVLFNDYYNLLDKQATSYFKSVFESGPIVVDQHCLERTI